MAVDGALVHARHELVEDGAGRLSLSIIPADWVGRVLVEPPDEPDEVLARWPGGIGDEPVFGEPA
ncbi:hypothetical protein ACW7BJ_16370 [Azospirillum argentinense]